MQRKNECQPNDGVHQCVKKKRRRSVRVGQELSLLHHDGTSATAQEPASAKRYRPPGTTPGDLDTEILMQYQSKTFPPKTSYSRRQYISGSCSRIMLHRIYPHESLCVHFLIQQNTLHGEKPICQVTEVNAMPPTSDLWKHFARGVPIILLLETARFYFSRESRSSAHEPDYNGEGMNRHLRYFVMK